MCELDNLIGIIQFKYPSPANCADVPRIILWDCVAALARRTIAAIANFAIFENRIERTNCRSYVEWLSLFIRTPIPASASGRDDIM